MNTGPGLSLPSPATRALLVLNAVLLFLLALAIHNSPAPRIEIEFGGATVEIAADRAWALLPGGCVTISWDLEGIHSLYVDGQGKIGWGEMMYCPTLVSTSPQFDITSANGEERSLSLDLRYLPMELLRSLLFFVILTLLLIAPYYLVTMRFGSPLPLNRHIGLALLALLIACVLGQTGDAFRLQGLVAFLGNLFASHSWQLFGVAMGGVVYIPLLIRALKAGRDRRATADFAAIAVFFVFLLLLYLPFGFDSIGHWEEWVVNAYFEGRPSKLSIELITRIWAVIPHALAYVISSESFTGYHVVNFFLFWGKLALLYGILRQLRLAPVYAFLTTMLFMVYPVNSGLMSLRSIVLQFSMLGLLAAVYLVLDCHRKNPSRLQLLGIWLGLIFNVSSSESAFVLILLAPGLWWGRCRKPVWYKVNWTVLWYLFPACKVIYLFSLMSVGQDFYTSNRISGLFATERAGTLAPMQLIQVLARVYENTTYLAWTEAFDTLGNGSWLAWSLMMVAVVAGATLFLSHVQRVKTLPAKKDAGLMLLAGLVLITPSVAVFIWFSDYRIDPWRMNFYVPIAASVAVLGLSVLLASPLGSGRTRSIAVSVLLLALMVPAANRLLQQHADFTRSAHTKAIMLHQMMEQAPAFDSNAIAIMLTDWSLDELEELGILEFESNMLDSAFHVLWQDQGPRFAVFCARQCHPSDIDYHQYGLNEGSDFDEMVIFRIYDDLTVELLPELPPEIGGSSKSSYNPGRLIEASAPLPPRALTMLASARRAPANP
ncbi:MAG: hypothetical protein OXT68_16650 [Chloroflexota bacterium]|nr:hypothetical protein [Chloroflexota bacterium]